MEYALHLLENHGYLVIFLVVLVDFLGAPITAIPLLLIGGALATTGKLSMALVALLAAVAAELGDSVWYGLGRVRGQTVLETMCKLSRNEQVCVTRSNQFVRKYGVASLLIAKFFPGIATFAPPAAGTAGMPLLKFLLIDAVGSIVWSSSFTAVGYIFSKEAHALLRSINESGIWNFATIAASVAIVVLLYFKKRFSLVRKTPLVKGMEIQ